MDKPTEKTQVKKRSSLWKWVSSRFAQSIILDPLIKIGQIKTSIWTDSGWHLIQSVTKTPLHYCGTHRPTRTCHAYTRCFFVSVSIPSLVRGIPKEQVSDTVRKGRNRYVTARLLLSICAVDKKVMLSSPAYRFRLMVREIQITGCGCRTESPKPLRNGQTVTQHMPFTKDRTFLTSVRRIREEKAYLRNGSWIEISRKQTARDQSL